MNNADVYRAPTLPETPDLPPRELVYDALDRDQARRGSALKLFALPAVFGGVVSIVFGLPFGALAAGAACAYAFTRQAKGPKIGAILRVDQGELLVFSRDMRRELLRLRLRDVADVRLDIRKIRRVQENGSLVAAERFASGTSGPEIDNARIEIVGTGKKGSAVLTDVFLAHMDATESLGKIRVFLRKHGWVPLDERDKAVSHLDAS